MLARALGLRRRLDPLAHASTLVHGLDEADGTVCGIGPVVAAHDGLDSLSGFVSVIKGDGADIVVQNVSLDDAMEEPAADEAKLAVNGRGSTFDKGPFLTRVVGKRWVGVLKESDGNCLHEKEKKGQSKLLVIREKVRLMGAEDHTYRASG